MLKYLKLIRIKHWIKNTFIFIPLFFSSLLFNQLKFFDVTFVALGFCLVTGFIYIFNDILDLEFDKKHPKKKFRPIAANIITIRIALLIGLLILSIGLLMIFYIDINSFFLTLFYVIMNLLYSYKLKKIPILDFIIVSIGFVIRLFIGSEVSEVVLSEWIIIMVFLLSLFISIAKRRDDSIALKKTKRLNREVIKQYSVPFLDNIMSIVASILLVCYLMFVTDDSVVAKYDSNLIYLTFLFVLIGIFRYTQLSIVYKISGSPVQILYSDFFIQMTLFLWVLCFYVIIY